MARGLEKVRHHCSRDSGNQGCPSNESQKDRLKADHESKVGFLFSRRTLIGRDVCSRSEHDGEQVSYKPLERAHQPPPRVQELPHDAPEFVPWRTAVNKGFCKHPNWESDYTRLGNVNTRQSQGSNYCPNYLWNVSGDQKKPSQGDTSKVSLTEGYEPNILCYLKWGVKKQAESFPKGKQTIKCLGNNFERL